MMIGGGGLTACSRADHGIGVTEANNASFIESGGFVQTEFDFGNTARSKNGSVPAQAYSLNLWIR